MEMREKEVLKSGEIQSLQYGLLSEEQVFGDEKSEVLEKVGICCRATDLAVILGSGRDGKGNGAWMLASSGGYGDVCIVGEDGSRKLLYADRPCGIRPVIHTGGGGLNHGTVAFAWGRDISGVPLATMGEYPQEEADEETSPILEREYNRASLRKTGKIYRGIYTEYEYEGEKFIRAKDPIRDRWIWIKVSPVNWYHDEREGLLISEKILEYGLTMSGGNYYDENFSSTPVYGFLNGSFREELVPSIVREETQEEIMKREEDMKKAAERRNPYGLVFGRVTEEDIIRGAIESDVPVFIHGPSSEGKSARVKQIDPTCEIIYLRNATPDSLNGRSVYNQSTGEMIDIPPTWFKKVKAKCEEEPDRFHVVFFDEINNALPSIQGMAFNIVLDREVNGLWKLPDNARVVAAGNDMQDSLAANQIAAPFFNRFAHVYINTTTEKWLKWARENRIHPAIYAYIAYKDGETLRSEYTGEKPNADPRKWEMASKMLYATGNPEMLRALIGQEITEEFVQFCNQPVITLERVLSGDYSRRELDELDVSQRYATVMGLSRADDSSLDQVLEFVEKLGDEFTEVFKSLRNRK